MLTILPDIYGHFIIWFLYIWQALFPYCMMKTNLYWKLLFLHEDLTKNNLQPWPYIRTCRKCCHPDLIYGPVLVSFRASVPPWPYILARPSIWHLRVPISLMMILRIRVLYLIIVIKSEVWPICHCLGLGHETMVGALCLSIFLRSRFYMTNLIIFIINWFMPWRLYSCRCKNIILIAFKIHLRVFWDAT